MNISSREVRLWSKLGQRGAFFGVAMPEFGGDKYVKLITADLALLSGLDRYVRKYPDHFLNVGIAEQNMIGIAAGLAMDGYLVYATTYAAFIAVRCLEQVRHHLSYLKCNVKLVGTSAGVVSAKSGVSHWATEDMAFMRVLPNMQVFSAADSLEAVKIMEYTARTDAPTYIRLSGGLNCPIVYEEDYDFIPGKLVKLKDGEGIAIIATGLMVAESLKTAELLEQKGFSVAVYNMHTIKPIDREGLKEIFETYYLVVTVEEHNIVGGMGSAVAEYGAVFGYTYKHIMIGVPDKFTEAGTQRYVWSQCGITDIQIADRILLEIGGRNTNGRN